MKLASHYGFDLAIFNSLFFVFRVQKITNFRVDLLC